MAADGKFAERAGAGMATLHSFYDDADGLWQKLWWNSANALEPTIEYLDRTGDATYADVIDMGAADVDLVRRQRDDQRGRSHQRRPERAG
jgi:hypothetical protein